MALENHVRNPIEWGWDQLRGAGHAVESAGRSVRGRDETTAVPEIRHISIPDLGEVLRRGLSDFAAYRTDVIFLVLIYPLIGLVLAYATFGHRMLPLLFPLASGFALVGPVAAVGLYEMSRRRERGEIVTWADAFGVVKSPAFGAIVTLGLMLVAIFALWLAAANVIYSVTLGPEQPESLAAFARDVIGTSAGWTMIVVGIGVGFLFALLVLMISVVSFPMLIDRDVGIHTAVETSVRAVLANPVPMLAWGLIVAASLVLGSLPLFLGLIFVIPMLGHATWHLYRRVVA
ncbi:MAG TPA: DUF2189 domain-containing protein [Alphaproteobacteria bacterium]|nr:DUF2189 domain-containing protein [Alphaproteobacteria bacterium]